MKIKKNNQAPAFFYIENLNTFSFVIFVLPRIIGLAFSFQDQNRSIIYLNSTFLGRIVASICCWLLMTKCREADFRLIDVKDEQGNWVRLRLEFHDLVDLHGKIMENPKYRKFVEYLKENPYFDNKKIESFLSKQALIFTWNEHDTIWRALLVVEIVNWFILRQQINRGKIRVFLNSRPWRKEIREYAQGYGLSVVFVKRFHKDIKLLLSRLVGENKLRYLYYDFTRYGWKGLLPIPRKPDLGPSDENKRPKIMVEYYGHLNLENPEYYSDLFFWQQSDLPGKDIMLAFNIPRDPLDQEKWQQLQRNEIEAVALNPRASLIPEVPQFNYFEPASRGIKFPTEVRLQHLPEQVRDYCEQFNYFEKLFERFDIKMYVSWFKYSARHCVIADALRSLGGISAVYQRAYDDYPSPSTMTVADIVFGFSNFGVEIERKSYSQIEQYVVVGYTGDHRFEILRPLAEKLRQQVVQAGAKRIIAYFDENSAADTKWNSGHEFMQKNYAFLLKKVLEDRSLGIFIKPKVPVTLRKRLGEVANLLRQAEATGRCVVFEGGALHGAYPPAIAALASDVAIHGHLCATTAGLESALTGTPTLLLDREGWPCSSLYDLGEGRVVFRDWDTLWAALDQHFKAPQRSAGFGKWDKVLHRMDPFRDGRASERIGSYLHWLIEGFKQGLPREENMQKAFDRYASIWGKDKVVWFNKP